MFFSRWLIKPGENLAILYEESRSQLFNKTYDYLLKFKRLSISIMTFHSNSTKGNNQSKKQDVPSLKIDGRGYDKPDDVKAPAKIAENIDKTKYDDFYVRLRKIYNKVPAPSVKTNKKQSLHVGNKQFNAARAIKNVSKPIAFSEDIKKLMKKSPKKKTERQKSPAKMERIKYKRSQFDEVDCKTVRYESPTLDANKEMYGKFGEVYEDSDVDDPDRFLTEEPLEKMFRKYVDRLTSVTVEMKNCQPGTKESIENCKYRLDRFQLWDYPQEAVTGKRKCDCPENIVIDGNTADLQDIKKAVKELKFNHKVTGVVVRMMQVPYPSVV